MSDQKFVPHQEITPHTINDEDFELLENEMGQNRDQTIVEQEQRDQLLKELEQQFEDQAIVEQEQGEEFLKQYEKDTENQAIIEQEQGEEFLKKVAQWEEEDKIFMEQLGREMEIEEKEMAQWEEEDKMRLDNLQSAMRWKQIQNKVAQNENQKFLGENQMAQEQLERKMEIDKGKEEKMRLEDPQIATLRKRFQDAVVQARKEVEKKKSQEEKSQKRLDFFEEIMMAQRLESEKRLEEEQEEKEKKMNQKEEKEMEILWDQFEWRMTQWKKEDKKIIFGEEMQKDGKDKKIQKENVVIEVEESDEDKNEEENEDEESLQDYNNKSDNEIRLERFLEIQSKAFNDPKFSDFTIICGKKEFKVHRVILALHSDLLFNHGTQDSQNSSTITLKDLDVNLVEKMLKFMYSGKVEGLEKNAHDLFLMARKFGVTELEKLCLETITKKITPSNVLNCLRLAFRFNLKELKQNAIFYACANIQEVQENKKWDEFAKENGEIVAAILKSVSERRDFLVGQMNSQGPVISMPGVQNQGPVISMPEKMTTTHCPLVPMPPVFVPQNQPSQKPRRQTKLQALSKQMGKNQGLSGKILHNPSLFVPLPQGQGPSMPKNQGTPASWDAEMLKQQQDMMEAAKNAHRVFEAAELYRKSCSSPQISAPLIPLPNPMMYPVFQEKYEDKNVPKLPEN